MQDNFLIFDEDSQEDQTIKAVCKIRPDTSSMTSPVNQSFSSVRVRTHPRPKEFNFDYVSGPNESQAEMFSKVGGLSKSFIEGYNCTIFAYGQTGSGDHMNYFI